MNLDPKKDHSIDLDTAAKLTKRFRAKTKPGDSISVAFNKAAIAGIMDQSGCVGLRMYFALTDEGKETVVLVGVDEKGNDLFKGQLMEWGGDCPPYCSGANPLNGES